MGRVTVEHLVADLQTPQLWATAVEEGSRRLGGIDVLVNCGGPNWSGGGSPNVTTPTGSARCEAMP
jgi:NAD(P)-dependent dehydrogenase (short-subunit alcohol dehydrogenase family)